MKLYRGVRTPDGCVVMIEEGDTLKPLPLRHDVRMHADGFNWGFNGGGARQLSLALLCDALDDTDRAQELSQHFKMRVLVHVVADEWTLTEEAVIRIVMCIECGGEG